MRPAIAAGAVITSVLIITFIAIILNNSMYQRYSDIMNACIRYHSDAMNYLIIAKQFDKRFVKIEYEQIQELVNKMAELNARVEEVGKMERSKKFNLLHTQSSYQRIVDAVSKYNELMGVLVVNRFAFIFTDYPLHIERRQS